MLGLSYSALVMMLVLAVAGVAIILIRVSSKESPDEAGSSAPVPGGIAKKCSLFCCYISRGQTLTLWPSRIAQASS